MLSPIKPKDSKITEVKQENNCIYLFSQAGILRVLIFNDDNTWNISDIKSFS